MVSRGAFWHQKASGLLAMIALGVARSSVARSVVARFVVAQFVLARSLVARSSLIHATKDSNVLVVTEKVGNHPDAQSIENEG